MLLATALRNAIQKEAARRAHGLSFECRLKNISINGRKTGCSGFVRCIESGGVAYVNTEHSAYAPLNDKCLFRYAANMTDYSSNGLQNGWNRFCSEDKLAACIVDLLYEGIGHPKDGLSDHFR